MNETKTVQDTLSSENQKRVNEMEIMICDEEITKDQNETTMEFQINQQRVPINLIWLRNNCR